MNDHNRRGGPGPLPERWLRCPRKAETLIIDKFLAFKTPLDAKFNDQVPVQHRFSPDMVFQSARNMISSAKHNERPRIGLWIDLTKTSRFYDSQIISNNDCKYMKIECDGHEGAPNIEQTRTFIDLCKIFVSRDPINLIGVHCTHGFNRTGFLIVSYLVEEMECSVEAALAQFANARKPGIYKEQYLKELYLRYDDVADAPSAPPLPDWCFDEQSEAVEETNFNKFNGNSRKKKGPRFKDNPTFMDGVPGTRPITDREEVTRIRRRIKVLTGQQEESFVGSQPVSMDRNNMKLLREKAYRVSWKADGTRYMMFINGKDEVYFIDRDNSVFKVDKLEFFWRGAADQHLTNTLLDGEMVIDKDGHKMYPRYLVYDIVYLQGDHIGAEAFFPTRWNAIQKDIIEPRIQAMKDQRIFKEREPFSVRVKPFYDIQYARNLLGEKFAKQLTHPPDGLIFQPVDDPYKYGTSDQVLKWKPSSMNSIDFKLEVRREQKEGCLPEYIGNLLVGQHGRSLGRIKCNKALRDLHNKIIECKLENNQWVFMRERTDKSFPNAERTAEAVLESIKQPVTAEMLLQFIENHGFKEPMPPPRLPPPVKRLRTS